MTTSRQTWAYLFEHPGADPVHDRTELATPDVRAVLVAVPDASSAPAVAVDLAAEGATLIELCGGMTTSAVAAVREALPDRVALGHVTFAADSLLPVAAHARAAEQGPAVS
ncbi:DUF6506 family protein [Aeromicrobium sp. CF4.19]|uniref:DUF6506 family protein n=1 Tax=Aeromicrobium sp. CF4.19 TaxID=3373082 RepID=UPI003EE7E1A2